ncbi:hypothetical protein Tco_0943614 [Tanacetum coccineum]
MKVWGCLAKFQIPLPKRTKLRQKTIDYVYLGPTKNSDAYRFLVYKINVADISNNTIIESAEVELFENTFPYMDKDKQISNQRKQVLDDQLSQDHRNNTFHVLQENVEPKRSKRAKVNKDFGPDYMTYIPTVSYFDDLDFFKDFENEFPAIVYNDAKDFENEFPTIVYNDAPTSKSDSLTEPILSPQHIDEFDLKDET